MSRVDQGETVGLGNGCYGAVRAGKWLEEVKRSRFIAGKMTLRTYEKTRAFYAKSGKKIQMRAQTRTIATQKSLF